MKIIYINNKKTIKKKKILFLSDEKSQHSLDHRITKQLIKKKILSSLPLKKNNTIRQINLFKCHVKK